MEMVFLCLRVLSIFGNLSTYDIHACQCNSTHTAITTRQSLQNADVDVIDWPAKSTDLNPIKHPWNELNKNLRRYGQQSRNVQQLRHTLFARSANLPQPDIQTLVHSMRRSGQAVIDVHEELLMRDATNSTDITLMESHLPL
jgi:hypothetical protein